MLASSPNSQQAAETLSNTASVQTCEKKKKENLDDGVSEHGPT